MSKMQLSQQQKDKWRKAAQQKEAAARELVISLAESFKSDPKKIAEYLCFAERFRQYSHRNTMLIMMQNPGSQFCQSFAAWKSEGYTINKGEHGMMVYVPAPYKKIVLPDGSTVRYSKATAEIQKKADDGEYVTRKIMGYKIGTTFDVSQTNFSVEEYPSILSVGYDDEKLAQVYDAVRSFCERELSCPVIDAESSIRSTVLNGFYNPASNHIEINPLSKDSKKLSTLTHEMGHAILHSNITNQLKPKAQVEFEADAISIMVCSKLGIEITENRCRHVANAYNEMCDAFTARLDKKDAKHALTHQIDEVFSAVFSRFGEASDQLDKAFIEHGISIRDPSAKLFADAVRKKSPIPTLAKEKKTIASVGEKAQARADALNKTHVSQARETRVSLMR